MTVACPRREVCYGYVDFDDEQWWKHFAVTPEYAKRVGIVRERIKLLRSPGAEDKPSYTALARALNESCFSISLPQYGALRNAALIPAIVALMNDAADAIAPQNHLVASLQQRIRQRAHDLWVNFRTIRAGDIDV